MSVEKTRIRSEAELAAQSCGLVELRDVLYFLEVPFFVGGGTLLGIVREGDFIPWDWDVHINLRTEDVIDRKDELVEALIKCKFKVVKVDESIHNFKIVLNKYGADYELMAWIKQGNMRYRNAFKLPDILFHKPEMRELRGELYPCNSPAEDYLEYQYGEWKTPLRSDDKDRYLSSKYHRKSTLNRFINNKIISIFRMLFRKIRRVGKIGRV